MAIRARKQGFSRKHKTKSPEDTAVGMANKKFDDFRNDAITKFSFSLWSIFKSEQILSKKKTKKTIGCLNGNCGSKVACSVKILSWRLCVNTPATVLPSCRVLLGMGGSYYYFPAQYRAGVNQRVCPSPERDINLTNLRVCLPARNFSSFSALIRCLKGF